VKDEGSGKWEGKSDRNKKKQLDVEVEGVGVEKKYWKEKKGRNKLSPCDICFSEWIVSN
jgi:hypothetical protein